MEDFRPYAEKFSEVLGSLAENAGEEASPLLVPREKVKKIHIVLLHLRPRSVRRFQHQPHDKAKNLHQKKTDQGMEVPSPASAKKGGTGPEKRPADERLHLWASWAATFGFNVAVNAGREKLVDGFLGR
jgi:F-type H+-transporting ATPase subunit gamma